MSLLLDALKKAELAKRASQDGAGEPAAPSSAAPDIDLTGDMPPAHPVDPPVVTRESLPDISSSLEIVSPEPNPPQGARAAASEPPAAPAPPQDWGLAEEEPPAAPAQDFPGGAAFGSGGDDARRAAQQVFQAKEVNYNPRRPFYITVALLLACGAGYAGYVWWQLQPHYVTNTAAVQAAKSSAAAEASAPQAAVSQPASQSAAVPATPQAGAPAAAGPGTTGSVGPAAGAAPATASTPPSAPTPALAAAAGTTVPTAVPAADARPARTAERAAGRAETDPARGAGESAAPRTFRPASRGDLGAISVSPAAQSIDPLVQQGYDAFQRGDLPQARDRYQRLLQRDVNSRDALLGLAAIDLKSGDLGTAQARYLRLLELDPRDAYALAGMAALNGAVDPVQSESRLKTLIADQPEMPDLHFALGNQLAAQKRWPEAQAEYFKAFSMDPGNPDYAFNLAISLDQMHQAGPALDYYRRAVALAATRAAAFDQAQAARRVKELSR